MSRRRTPALGQVARQVPKPVASNTPRQRVAARPRLVLLAGGLHFAQLTPDARRVVSVLPSSGSLAVRTVALLARLPADDLAVTVALLVESGWIAPASGERRTLALTPAAQTARRRHPARCTLRGEVAA